jgi:hypothetical protein
MTAITLYTPTPWKNNRTTHDQWLPLGFEGYIFMYGDTIFFFLLLLFDEMGLEYMAKGSNVHNRWSASKQHMLLINTSADLIRYQIKLMGHEKITRC